MEKENNLRAIGVAAALALIVSLCSCGSGPGTQDLSPTSSEAPVINSHPVKVVRVFGTVAASFSIRIFGQFLSSAPVCRRTVSLLAGAKSPIGVWSELTVHRTGDQYETLVALDRYAEGTCGWHARLIAFYISDQNGISTDGEAQGLGLPGNTGPIPFIWVEEPGKIDPLVSDPTHPGLQMLPTITVRCREGEFPDPPHAKTLYCNEISPPISAVIDDEARRVHLNFLGEQNARSNAGALSQ